MQLKEKLKEFLLSHRTNLFIGICLSVGLILRIVHALTTEYSIHPDEVMQYLERAHLMVFGNGIIYVAQALGMRSLLVPSFIAFWLWLCKALGMASPTIYIPVVKIAFVLLSMAIPIGMYRLARRNYRGKYRANYGKVVALAALMFGSFWYELVYWAHKPLTGIVATSLIFLYFALEKPNMSLKRLWMLGLLLTLALGVRVHYAPLLALMFFYTIFHLEDRRKKYHFMLACVSGFLIFLGVLDWITLGNPFHSHYTNIYVNVFKGFASHFGVSPFYQYFLWMEDKFYFLLWIGLAYGLFTLLAKKDWFILASFMVVMLSLSRIGHKEYRFIFGAIPFYLILLSACWIFVLQLLVEIFSTSRGRLIIKFIIKMAEDVLGDIQRRFFSSSWSTDRKRMTNTFILASILLTCAYALALKQKGISKSKNAFFVAFKAIANDPDATGVIIISLERFSKSSGYYYLHKKIPFYTTNRLRPKVNAFVSIKKNLHLKNEIDLRTYASHILIRQEDRLQQLEEYFFPWETVGDFVIWKRKQIDYPQKMWSHYQIDDYTRMISRPKFNWIGTLRLRSNFKEAPAREFIEPE